ncbi:MAG: sensor histidine kinase [Candidatus Marinimicrobia bacterium]|nr:sensor histidine kinase [Candidatus Neomarinimicrobiota bacterium]
MVIDSEKKYKKLSETLRIQKEKLKILSNELRNTQERERVRISRNLHDEIGQTLTAISLNLELINKNGKTKDLDKWIMDCQNLIDKTIDDVHRISYELRPSVLDNLGIFQAFRTHIRGFINRTGIDVELNDEDSIYNLDDKIKTTLYRVMQEALNNVAKHADAQKVIINIYREKKSVLLRITDDGSGFDLDNKMVVKPENGGLGLQGIQERVWSVGGEFTILSKEKIGTTLKIDIPLGES